MRAVKVIPVIEEVNSRLESDKESSSLALSKLINPEIDSPDIVAASNSDKNSQYFEPDQLLEAQQHACMDGRTTQDAQSVENNNSIEVVKSSILNPETQSPEDKQILSQENLTEIMDMVDDKETDQQVMDSVKN